MRLLIVHLSDIHLKGSDDPILARASKIADAVKSRQDNIDRAILILSGDIAFSGKPHEYEGARSFIKQIAQQIGDDPLIVVVPGNHDCDFAKDTRAREILISSIQHHPEQVDETVIEQCLVVQGAFFDFRDSLTEGKSLTHPGKLYYEYSEFLSGDRLVIRCYDTAWISRLEEVQGTLVFPSALAAMSDAQFAVSTFHHPYNWHTPDRHFRRLVEQRSDLILTGHEHEHDRQVSHRPEQFKTTTYIEGSALQHSDDCSNSAFNVMLVDTTEEQYQFHHFDWRGDLYRPASESDTWERLPLQAQRFGKVFELTDKHKAWLADPGIPNLTRAGKERSFESIFIYPDLIEWFTDPTLKKERQTIKSDQVFEAIRARDQLFILAPPKAGRTALAKKLFSDFLNVGLVPIYLDGATSRLRASNGLPTVVLSAVKDQYGYSALEAYRQLDRSKRVVLIDNIDRAKENSSALKAFITKMHAFAEHVIVFGDDVNGRISDLTTLVEGPSALHRGFQIRPLGIKLRERLAQQWFGNGTGSDLDDVERTKLLEEIARTLNTIIGRNYVPGFPLFVIAVIRAIEEGTNVETRAGTQGYFYEVLIKLALAGATATDYGIRIGFLTHLAYEMFERDTQEFLESELRASFDRYQETYKIGRLEFDNLISSLISRGMLLREADGVRFRYPYLYYYFVANRIRDRVSDPKTQEIIERLATNLADQESSDILMFLVHLSNDRFILEKLLSAASQLYNASSMATLDQDSLTGDEDVSLSYEETAVDEARLKRAELQDSQLERAREAEPIDPSSEVAKIRATFGSALHTIRILGQVLRNFPGTLEAEWKVALTKACYSLGLRTLGYMLDIIEKSHDELLDVIKRELAEAYQNVPDDKIKERAEQYLWFTTVILSFTILRLIGNAIAAPELEPIYDEALEPQDTPALRLLSLSLQMYLSSGFPDRSVRRFLRDYKKKSVPFTVLKLFAMEHFELISVPVPMRKSICALLEIQYKVLALPPGK